MNKEIILEKSRKLKKDEGKEYYKNKGNKIGTVIFMSFMLFFSMYAFYFEINNKTVASFYIIGSVISSLHSVQLYYVYKFTNEIKNKKDFICRILIAVICIIATVLNICLNINIL